MYALSPVSGSSGEFVTDRTTGSAACAQHPHVTQVGAHVSSSRLPCSKLVQGSPATSVATPEAVNDNSATTTASANRRTRKFYQRSLVWCGAWAFLVGLAAAGCASHGVVHDAPDESRPHISWEIRTGGETGDDDLACGSGEAPGPCVFAASTEERRTLATVHVLVHAAAQTTSYLGFIRAPFFEGDLDRKIGEINETVEPGSEPAGKTVIGRVTSRPGSYALIISIDAEQPGAGNPVHIGEEIPVVVR
jgi:hypothetical protein